MNAPDEAYTILAIETSCDETAAAVVRGGHEILANVVASQIDEHRRYGGVVPEVASRQHILALTPVIREALEAVPGGWSAIHAIAATNGPGLAGALMTGLNAAKALAWGRDLPFVGVNHMEAHIYANWLSPQTSAPEPAVAAPATLPQFPLVALVVSGGHTLLALLEGHGRYRILGQTRDDAAGEAFDKVARIMGLGFPGGPAIQQVAERSTGGVTLPRAWLRDSYDFSFSGLKTAVLHHVREREEREARVVPHNNRRKQKGAAEREAKAGEGRPDGSAASPKAFRALPIAEPDKFIIQLAYAFQESVVDVLVTKSIDAAKAFGATEILLAGGVAANTRLRSELKRRSPVPVRFPPIQLCTDNAAMIAAAAYYRFAAGIQSGWELDVAPNLRLGM